MLSTASHNAAREDRWCAARSNCRKFFNSVDSTDDDEYGRRCALPLVENWGGRELSVGIHKQLAALVVAIAAATLAGCCCCGPEVPVDCEDFCACLQYHGPDCCNYPFSCPRCPYYDYNNCFWHSPYFYRPNEGTANQPQPTNSRGVNEIVPPDDPQSRRISQ